MTSFDPDIHVPGLWGCAKCGFTLLQSNLNAKDGSITARDEPGDKCPNDGAPLWRVTWRQQAEEMGRRCEEAIERAVAAEGDKGRPDPRLLGAALLWLRNHYESSAETLSPLTVAVLARADEIIADCKIDISDSIRLRESYPVPEIGHPEKAQG